jgi:hypothetical protein
LGMNTNPSDRAMKCAEALQSEWKIGNSSRFCDDAPDWDTASTADIARIIDRHYGELVKALRGIVESSTYGASPSCLERASALRESIEQAVQLLKEMKASEQATDWDRIPCACVNSNAQTCARWRDGVDPENYQGTDRRCECSCHDMIDDYEHD